MFQPAVLMVAPNGARRTKADHPNLPITPRELARTAAECEEEGANAIHLHVRDDAQAHVLDADRYRAACKAVRDEVGQDFVIQITTEAVGRYNQAEQIAVIRDVRPQAFSVGLRELFPDTASEGIASDFLAWTVRERIACQFILYDTADLQRYLEYGRRGVIPFDRHSVIFVLGRYAENQESDPNDLRAFLDCIDAGDNIPQLDWMVCAFGRGEQAAAAVTLGLGGHMRVGFENSLWHADGWLAASNAEKASKTRRIATTLGRERPDTELVLQVLGHPG